ncbi:ABC transporter substrate-binding protein [Prauserella flavalba]|uniref:ABC transporter substrate-binding protein n=1 Tax=Prauserella flavalba TaxID=1477506 RepID=UPI000D76E3D6|nr:ABC transporter substrate-binding protein [Prauserella flavalba]
MVTTAEDDGFAAIWPRLLTRRNLLHTISLGAGAAAVGSSGLLLSGCTAEAPPQAGNSSSGTLTVSLFNAFPSLDPLAGQFEATQSIANLWSERLYRVDPFPPRAQLSRELAKGMPLETSPGVYRVRLEENRKFHNGIDLDASDVVHTLNRIKDPAENIDLARFFELFEQVRAVGRYEVEFKLRVPISLMVERLSAFPVLPKSVPSEQLKLRPIGSGPYRVTSAVSEKSVRLEKFEEYKGRRNQSYEVLDISIVEDGNARISGLRTAKFDVIEQVPPAAYQALKGDDGVKEAAVDSYRSTTLIFNCGKPPFNDARMRRAVCYALDRDAITRTSFFGLAQPCWGGWIPEEHPEYVQPEVVYKFSPTRARQLIREAGYGSDPVPIDFLIFNESYVISQQPIIEQNLRDVGFLPNMVPGGLGLYARVPEGRFGALLGYSDASTGSPDVDFLLRFHFYGPLPRQFAHWDSPALTRIETLLDEAIEMNNGTQRRERWAEAQSIVQNEVPIAALHRVKQLTAWRSELSGFRALPGPGFLPDGVSG